MAFRAISKFFAQINENQLQAPILELQGSVIGIVKYKVITQLLIPVQIEQKINQNFKHTEF